MQYQYGAAAGLLVRSDIGSAQDLAGKTIAVPSGSMAHYQLQYFLRLMLRTDDVNVMFAAPSQYAELWRQRAIDGAYIWDPILSDLKRMFEGRILVSASAMSERGDTT